MNTHIYFMIRYSVYTRNQGWWQIGKNVSSDKYRNALFSESRLLLHEKLFFDVTLPSLKEISSTSKITALIFISEELPEPFKSNLLNAEADYAWLEVITTKSDKALNTQIDRKIEEKLRQNEEDVCYATVRLDDDDALASDFGVELTKYLKPEFSGMGVTFPKGVFAVYDGNQYSSFYHYKKANNAQGLALICIRTQALAGESPLTVFGTGNHTSIDDRYPTVNDSSKIMFIRSEHEGSDLIASGRLRDKTKMKELSGLEYEELRQRFRSVKIF